jgi:hypothetical protein
MDVFLFGPKVLIWFSAAYLFGVGGFWISFAETLSAASIPSAAGLDEDVLVLARGLL